MYAMLFPVRQSLNQARSIWHAGRYRCGVAAARLARASRLVALSAGVPLARETLVLECRRGGDASGFFSEFAAVLGILEHYERWQHLYAGLRVDFGHHGLYFEPAFGSNWWEYYFERIAIGDGNRVSGSVIGPYYHDQCANRVEREMSRETGSELIQRHITVKLRIREIVDAYVRKHWDSDCVIGIHYRGTDKAADAPRVPYQAVEAAAREAMRDSGSQRCRVFLATDEQDFLDYMRQRFPDQLLYREMFRSVDGRPIDVVNPDGNYKKGEDAIVDCLLLSRTHRLIRTASNLGLCATMFNPSLPEKMLNRER